MTVSVVIVTKNQRAYLAQTLPILRGQTGWLDAPPQIIVVDSGSGDGALDLVRAAPGVEVVGVDGGRFNYARAHNAGASRATGDIIARLSGDAVPVGPRWLADLTQPFVGDPKVALTWGGQILPTGMRNPVERLAQFLYHRADPGDAPRRFRSPRTVLGCNMAIRRALWEQRPYDERLPQAEDYAWFCYWARRGYAGVSAPAARVAHGHDEPLLRSVRRALAQSLLQGLILTGARG